MLYQPDVATWGNGGLNGIVPAVGGASQADGVRPKVALADATFRKFTRLTWLDPCDGSQALLGTPGRSFLVSFKLPRELLESSGGLLRRYYGFL